MKYEELINIELNDGRGLDAEQKHTPYSRELKLFSCIQLGDTQSLMKELEKHDFTIVTGKLSENSLTQYKYIAVSTVTLAVRYAIQGGLNEKIAYELSDDIICNVDKIENENEIIPYLVKRILELTQMITKSKSSPIQSPYVKKCIRYINENMHKKITVTEIAEYCGVSPDYLSNIFKKEMNEKLSSYITFVKLEQAKRMLEQGLTNKEIYSSLGFSSPSHLSTAFRKRYNMTPGDYVRLLN